MSEPGNHPTRFKVGNPGGQGRTPQSVKLAKRLLAETDDGKEMDLLVLGIARGTARMGGKGKRAGKAWSEASRRWAIEMIYDRMHGKAKQSIELGVAPTGQRLNRAALTDEEAVTYQLLLRKMAAPIDAPPPMLELPSSSVVEAVATAVAMDPAGEPDKDE